MQRFLLLLSAGFLALSLAQSCYDSGDKLINGRCYKLVKQQLSFNDARNWCHYSNPQTSSYLATVADQTTDTFLASYARTAFNTNEGHFWIGLSRPSTSSRYQWDSGTPFAWSNFELQTAQNYVAESIANGKWSNYGADARFNFVCSYDPNAPPTFSPNTDSTVPQSTQFVTEETSTATPDPWSTFSPTWGDVTPTPTDYVCNPDTATSTFLFAYSTEMIPSVLSETKAKVIQALNADPRRYRKFADVRYDCVNGSTINYHDDVQSFSASIDSHPPETSLMFPDPSNNTDVFEVLETFLNNTSIPKCGSTALILVKRYTKINRGFRMASTLQQEHITVHFIQSNYMPYGGNLGSTNNVAGRTGGVYVLTGRNLRLNDATFPAVTEKVMGVPYLDTLIYGHYLDRSQNNSTDTELEPLHVPNCQRDMVNVTLFIATDIVKGYSSYFFQSINLTLVDQTSNQRTLLSYDQSDYFNDSDSIWKSIQLKSGTSYKIFMTYRTSFGGRLQIRMYIDQSVYGTESDSQS